MSNQNIQDNYEHWFVTVNHIPVPTVRFDAFLFHDKCSICHRLHWFVAFIFFFFWKCISCRFQSMFSFYFLFRKLFFSEAYCVYCCFFETNIYVFIDMVCRWFVWNGLQVHSGWFKGKNHTQIIHWNILIGICPESWNTLQDITAIINIVYWTNILEKRAASRDQLNMTAVNSYCVFLSLSLALPLSLSLSISLFAIPLLNNLNTIR